MFDKGLITGQPDGTYRPAEFVNRAQMAVFLQQMSGEGSIGPIIGTDKLNGLDSYELALNTHAHGASDIFSGMLLINYFSAYSDLSDEGRVIRRTFWVENEGCEDLCMAIPYSVCHTKPCAGGLFENCVGACVSLVSLSCPNTLLGRLVNAA